MRSLVARLQKLEEHFDAVGCSCAELTIFEESAQRVLTDEEIEQRRDAMPKCAVHGTQQGLLVVIRRYSVSNGDASPRGTGHAPGREAHAGHLWQTE